jgi:protein TonB
MKSLIPVIVLVIIFTGLKAQTKNDSILSNSDIKELNNVDIKDSIERSKVFVVFSYPEFPGGFEKFKQYIKNNLRWPANSKGIEGKVIVTFVIEVDGSLTDIKVARGLSPEFDEEAIRLIRECPKWKPATRYDKKPVRVAYSMPIPFKLNN